MLFNSHIPAYAMSFVGKVCGLVQSTWGTSLGEDKLGAGARILNAKVARRATIPPKAKPVGCLKLNLIIISIMGQGLQDSPTTCLKMSGLWCVAGSLDL